MKKPDPKNSNRKNRPLNSNHQLPAQPNQSLIDGITCLQEIISDGRPRGVRELARDLGLNVTRVNRLLKTLSYMGLVSQTSDRKYQPGPAVHTLAAQSLHGSHLLSSAIPYLWKLYFKGDLNITLGVLWKAHICYIFSSKPSQPFDASFGKHQLEPVSQSSAGLILLSYTEYADSIEKLKTLDFRTPLDDQRVRELHLSLERFREQGFAAIHFRDQTITVGVPIGQNPVAGLAVSKIMAPSEIPRYAVMLYEIVDNILRDMKEPLMPFHPDFTQGQDQTHILFLDI